MSVFPTIGGQRVYTQLKPFVQNSSNLNNKWDVIVIGSGMAGMTCASALAKFGRRVLVIEKHYLPGGLTHMFSRKGAHWDVGVHAIGDFHETGRTKRQLDWLTNKKIEMISLGNPYDRFYFPDNFDIGFSDSIKGFKAELIKAFPEEEKVINQYINLCYKAIRDTGPYFLFKTFPKSIGAPLDRAWRKITRDWWSTTSEEILDEIGASFRLRNVLMSQWGYHGNRPKESSFGIQALILGHFAHGAYYPKGGSKEFATHLLDNVIKAGGQVVCQAEVEELLMDGDKCLGVRLKSGHAIKAHKTVAAIPLRTTVTKLVSSKWRESSWAQSIKALKYSPAYICLNLIFEGIDIKEIGGTTYNKWFITEWDMNKELNWNVSKPHEKASILYVSFPSLKDPEHDPGEKILHTGECVTFVPWDIFEKWKNTEYQDRPVDYEELKKQIQERLIEQLKENIPELMKYCVYTEISTPLTAQHFVNVIDGSIYGMESSPERFNNPELRTHTPIKNFYLSGVDVVSTGVGGAMASGLMTAATLEPRIYPKLL